MIRKRRALNTFSPVKTNTSLKCTLKIPGIFEQLSDHKIATGPQRQPHRIAKNEQPLARFSPRRVVNAPDKSFRDKNIFLNQYETLN